jgi:hypothetical protein
VHTASSSGSAGEVGITIPLALFGAEDLSSAPPNMARRRPAADLRFFGMYYAAIDIGGQRFNVQLDTGSSNLVVPAADCNGCVAGLRRYRHDDSPTSEPVGCKSESCSGYCNPTECTVTKGATCDVREAPPSWALALLSGDDTIDAARPLCADDASWNGPDGRGCDKFRENNEWCGEGESVARCPASCGSCGRCCTASNGCFFEQTYADQSGATGALFVDNLSLVGLSRSGDRTVAKARITFGAASMVAHSTSVPFTPLGVDGVLGIGYSWLNCHPTCVPAPLDALLGASSPSNSSGRAGAGDKHNLFALCLATPSAAVQCINQMYASEACVGKANAGIETASTTDLRAYAGAGGSWDLGWLDAAKYAGQLQFLPILHESYYIVRAPIAAKLAPPSDFSGKPNEKGFGESGMLRGLSPKMWGLTVFDSGTAHSLIPPEVFEILKPALLSKLEVQLQARASASVDAPLLSRIFDDMCVPAPANGFSKKTIADNFPVLQLVFRGFSEAESGGRGRPFSLSWGPEHYLYSSPNNPFATLGRPAGSVSNFDGPDNHQWLCSGIIPSGDRTVLGASFLRAFYTVFDRANKRIGVAPSTSKCIPAGACVNNCFTGTGEESTAGLLPRHFLSFESFGAAGTCAVVFLLGCRRRCGRIVLSMCARCCC